jgi:hypothetical protein
LTATFGFLLSGFRPVLSVVFPWHCLFLFCLFASFFLHPRFGWRAVSSSLRLTTSVRPSENCVNSFNTLTFRHVKMHITVNHVAYEIPHNESTNEVAAVTLVKALLLPRYELLTDQEIDTCSTAQGEKRFYV